MRVLHGALACLAVGFVSAPGLAQSPSTWSQLLSVPEKGVSLQWTLRTGPDGNPLLLFRNVGSVPLHFGYYLQGQQSMDDAAGNGRMHLDPGTKVSISLKVAPQGVTLIRVRAGVDDGDYLVQ